jgi:hypothetical protein
MNDTRVDMLELDEALRDLLDPAGHDPDVDLDARTSRSRGTARVRLHMAYADGASKWRRVRVAAVVAFATAAVFVAAALAPGGGGDGGDGAAGGSTSPLERLTSTASAGEVLDTAADLVARSGPGVGEGDVWHGVARTYHDADLVSVNEQWFATSAPRYLQVAWGRDTSLEHQDVLLVDRVGEDDVQRIRTYVRPEDGDWGLPEGLSPTNAMDVYAGARQRQLVLAMHEWLQAVSRDGATPEQLRAATNRFMGMTGDYFSMQPEVQVDEDGRPVFDVDQRDHQRMQDIVRARQVVYLLTTVRATPRATAELYELMGGLESLERLGNVDVGDRVGIRLRYDMSNEQLSPHRERVLVLDADTGAVLRTETVDRTSWTTVEPAERVAEVGDDRVLCEDVDAVPCELLEGTGEVAARSDEFARDMEVRYAVHRENRRLKAELGDAAPAPMCVEMSDVGECQPQSEEERRRIAEIAADVDALRAVGTFDNDTPRTGDDDAFLIGVRISSVEDPNGVWSSSGQCSRDWRQLTICRG